MNADYNNLRLGDKNRVITLSMYNTKFHANCLNNVKFEQKKVFNCANEVKF